MKYLSLHYVDSFQNILILLHGEKRIIQIENCKLLILLEARFLKTSKIIRFAPYEHRYDLN